MHTSYYLSIYLLENFATSIVLHLEIVKFTFPKMAGL